jgi:hypothetical protein
VTHQPPARRPVRGQPVRPEVSPWPFVGMAGMAATFFPYAASGLVAPPYGVVVLMVIWAALLVVACRWWSRHPRLVPVVPVVAIAVLFAAVWFGGAVLDWSA